MSPYLTPTRVGLLSACLCVLPACLPEPQRKPDVLLITLDTLRSDFISAYGYPRESTPHLDALAEQGALFENHVTTIATTAPAHATLFTGLFAREHGLTKNGQVLSDEFMPLPELLQLAGYRTGASIGASILGSEHGFARGFDDFDEDFGESVLRPAGKTGKYERYAESVVDRAIAIAQKSDARPLFLWVHVYDAHDPYSPPVLSPLEPEKHAKFFRKRAEASEAFDRELLSRMLAGYEAEVYYVDREVGRLLAAWDARPTGPDSLVLVTSDHGEGLGEHGFQGHGFLLYEEQVKVPLILRMRGRIEPGTRVEAATSSVDLAATVFELIGLGDQPSLRGLPLLGPGGHVRAGGDVFAERRFYSDMDLQRSPALRRLTREQADLPIGSTGEKCVLLRDGWKLVWNESGAHELYDLSADPRESDNRFESESERAVEMLSALETWRQRGYRGSAAPDAAEPDGATKEMLDALGY